LAAGGFLEHADVFGGEYGVPRQQVDGQLAEGTDVYVRTDVQRAASIRKLVTDAVLVFIAPASIGELEARIRARGADDEERVQRRLKTAATEMARQSEFEYVIVNEPGRLEVTADRLAEILESERFKPANP